MSKFTVKNYTRSVFIENVQVVSKHGIFSRLPRATLLQKLMKQSEIFSESQ